MISPPHSTRRERRATLSRKGRGEIAEGVSLQRVLALRLLRRDEGLAKL
jgi:hypothetical protein